MTAIATAIKRLSGVSEMQNTGYIIGTVDSVNESARTCDITVISDKGESIISDVTLMSEIDDGILILPAIGSTVVIASSEKINYFVCLFSELQKILYIVGGSAINIVDGLIQINDGSCGGLVKVIELTQKINSLENLVNSILTTLTTTVIPLAPSGTYPFAPLYSSISTIAPITQRSDIENNLITHGSSI